MERFTEWGLTAAEMRVAEATIRGLKDKEIAKIFAVSPLTVLSQQRSIKIKMDVRTRTEMVGKLVAALIGERNGPQKA